MKVTQKFRLRLPWTWETRFTIPGVGERIVEGATRLKSYDNARLAVAVRMQELK